MRDPSSTVGQEIDLARAYLSIARIGAGEKLRFAIDVSNDAIDARLPPMILLPLIERVAVPPDPAAAGRSIRVVVAPEGERLQLRVIADKGPLEADRSIGEIRERLAALYDDRASLAIRGPEAVLDLPLEPRR
jgi:LytS/YehU family sensor histidine kinase